MITNMWRHDLIMPLFFMRTQKITVIITNWNYGMFLRECVDSVLSQTVLPHKIIFADDGSTDNSSVIEDEYCEQYPDLFMKSRVDQNEGLIKNLNRTYPLVESEWMFYLAADDKIDKTYIEKALKVIEERDERLAIIYCDMKKFGNWDGDWIVSEWDENALRQGNYINGHAVMRTSVLREVGGYRDTGGFEDHQLWVDFVDLKRGYYGVRIPEMLVWYRRHDFGHRTDKSDITKRQNI